MIHILSLSSTSKYVPPARYYSSLVDVVKPTSALSIGDDHPTFNFAKICKLLIYKSIQ